MTRPSHSVGKTEKNKFWASCLHVFRPPLYAVDAGGPKMPEKHWGTNSVPPDVATKSARPHTAHGLRESDIAKGRSEAAPVVAGARGMMRYTTYCRRILFEE